jgi:hypothetical protein
VFEYLSGRDRVERCLAEGRGQVVRTDLPQLDLKAEFASPGFGAIQPGYIDTNDFDSVEKRNEWFPEIQRFGPGATNVEYAKMLLLRRKCCKIERQTKLRRVAGKRFGCKSTPSELLQR